MSTHFDQLAADAMKLPVRDRVRLAQQLVSTLDEDVETASQAEIDGLWFAESERRLEELRSGSVEGVDSAEAFRRAREDLQR